MTMLQRVSRGVLFLARGAVTSVIGNISLALLALLLALSLWLFVTDRENPTETQVFNSAIPVEFVNVPNSLAVANVSGTSVRVRIEAPANELENLDIDDFEAVVNLGGFDRGTQNVSVDVTTASRRVDVVDITPARIDVTLETLRTKEVPVTVSLVGSPQSGFAAIGQDVQPQRVSVSGAESLVELVDSAVAEVSLTAQRVSLTDERVRLQPQDARGGQIARVTVNPETARVDVEIQQQEFSLEFAVTPEITGQPASGFNVGGVSIEPRLVVVTGSLDVLQSIDALRGISTEEISIAGERDDVTRSVGLILPEGARAEGVDAVRVSVDVRAAQGEFSFGVVPQVRNLGDGLIASVSGSVIVTLAGDVPALQVLSPADLGAFVDADGLGPGLHLLPVQLTPPAGTNIVRVDPGEIGVGLGPAP
jgi:YbbR domain-containing protein